jgi:HAD superfamily hydrolase (TIGR01549 family)
MSSFFFPQKKVVFFDMNNTLVDRRRCFDFAFLDALSEFTGRWAPEASTWTAQDALHSYKLEWSRARKAEDKPPLSSEEIRIRSLKKALEPYPIRVNEAFAKIFFDQVELAEEKYVSLFPGVEEVLNELSKRYKLAIISNGKRSRLERNLRNLKLERWFPEHLIFSSLKDGPRKPHSALFEAAMKATGTKPIEGVMVGNSWKNDIIGATRCGLDAIWIYPAHAKKISRRKVGKHKILIIKAVKQLDSVL